jgi:thymidine phosphorylase
VRAAYGGVDVRLGALSIGRIALELGAGRRTKEDTVDHAVGVVCRAKRGDVVAAGDVIAEIHARDEKTAALAVDRVQSAYGIGDDLPGSRGILLDVVE